MKYLTAGGHQISANLNRSLGTRHGRDSYRERAFKGEKMFGKKGKEYVRFERWILILIVVVFALRLGLSLAGASKAYGSGSPEFSARFLLPKATEWVSINLVLLVGILYCGIAVQARGFGTYKHLFPLLLF